MIDRLKERIEAFSERANKHISSWPLRRKIVIAFLVDAFLASLPLLLASPLAVASIDGTPGQGKFVGQFVLVLGVSFSWLLFHLIAVCQGLRRKSTPGQNLMNIVLENQKGSIAFAAREIGFGVGGFLVLFFATPLLLAIPVWSLIDKDQKGLKNRLSRMHFQEL